MGITKCQCGRQTDFGTLCVFCSRDRLLDRPYDEEATQPCTSDEELEEEADEEIE